MPYIHVDLWSDVSQVKYSDYSDLKKLGRKVVCALATKDSGSNSQWQRMKFRNHFTYSVIAMLNQNCIDYI